MFSWVAFCWPGNHHRDFDDDDRECRRDPGRTQAPDSRLGGNVAVMATWVT